MKFITKPLLFTLSLLAITACREKRNYSIEYPVIGGGNDLSLDIKSINVTDSSTVLSLIYSGRQGMEFMINPELSIITDDNVTLALQNSEGFSLSDTIRTNNDGKAVFSLVFPPVPNGIKAIDFKENVENGWKIWDIDITERQDAFMDIASVPSKLKKPKDGSLLPAVMECDSSFINIHVVNYDSALGRTLLVTPFTLTAAVENFMVDLDEKGEVSFGMSLQGPANISVVTASSYTLLARAWIKPGETIDVYIDSHSVGERIMSRREGDLAKNSHGKQRWFTTGYYSDLNNLLAKNQSLWLYDMSGGGVGHYKMNGDEYTQAVIDLRSQLLDSVNADENLPEMLKEFNRIALDAGAMAIMGEHRLANRASFFKNHPGYYDAIPDDSLCTVLNDDNYRKVIDIIDTSHPAFPMALIMSNSKNSTANWDNLGEHGRIFAAQKVYGRLAKKASDQGLNEFDRKTLAKLYDPFYLKAANDIEREAIKSAEEGAKLMGKIPDVENDRLFDAIIEQYKGKVVLVDLWNTWCGPCRAGIEWNEPNKDGVLSSDDIVWIYIADESSPVVSYSKMIPKIRGNHYRLTKDQIRPIQERFGIDGIPFYILVDKQGIATGRPDMRDHNRFKSAILDELSK